MRRRKKNDVIAQENARMLARLNNVRPSKQLAPGGARRPSSSNSPRPNSVSARRPLGPARPEWQE